MRKSVSDAEGFILTNQDKPSRKSLQLYQIKQHILYVNLEKLARQSINGGFYTFENRMKIYKMFLKYSDKSRQSFSTLKKPFVRASRRESEGDEKVDDSNGRDEDDNEKKWLEIVYQIKLDVNRTFGTDPVCSSDREIMRENLTQLLLSFFKNAGGDWLSYYQVFWKTVDALIKS